MKVFISGGSRGIGWALAKKFHAKGFEVAICGRSADSLKKAAESLPGLQTFVCDMSVKSEVKDLVAAIGSAFGSPDILINNAGAFIPGKVSEEADEVLEELWALNVAGTYYLTKGLLPDMVARKSGSIVNMSSIAGLKAYDNGGAYSITKFALLGFSKNLREEMKPHGIRVISVMPGAVYTDPWVPSGLPESRFIAADDLAELIVVACTVGAGTVVEELVVRPQLGDI